MKKDIYKKKHTSVFFSNFCWTYYKAAQEVERNIYKPKDCCRRSKLSLRILFWLIVRDRQFETAQFKILEGKLSLFPIYDYAISISVFNKNTANNEKSKTNIANKYNWMKKIEVLPDVTLYIL